MFIYTLSRKFRQRGLSPDTIQPEMRNRFDIIINDNILDCKIQVKLEEKVVRFFYYKGSVDKDLLIEEKYKEIASISLSNKKETGHDILFFRQQVRIKIEDSQDSFKDFKFELKNDKVYGGFPFIDIKCSNNSNNGDNKGIEDYVFFMQFCLLHFILDIEDRHSDFAQSSHCEKIREKLRESFVYQLLFAKLKYIIRLYEDADSLNQADYSFVTRKYTELLIDPRINKVIAPFNYPEKGMNRDSDKQFWFYDPEEELETILEKNRRQENLQEEYKNNALTRCLEESLVLKIRDFLYTKLAVSQAMTRNISKKLFWCAQSLMAITSLALLISSFFDEEAIFIMHRLFPIAVSVFSLVFILYHLLFYLKKLKENKKIFIKILKKLKENRKIFIKILKMFKKNKKICRYIWYQLCLLLPSSILAILSVIFLLYSSDFKSGYFYVPVVFCIFLWIVLSGWYNYPEESRKKGFLLPLFPRIMVAELAAWLTIGFSEDLVKSMLWVEGGNLLKAWAAFLVLILVAAILYGQANQLSPYKQWYNLLGYRVLPILNHAVFFALIIGVLIQSIFYENHIKKSDVMSGVVFKEYFDEANLYNQLLLDLENGQKQYQDYYLLADLKDIKMRGIINNTQLLFLNDTTEIQSILNVSQQLSNESPIDEMDKHNSIVNYYNHVITEINDFYKQHIDISKQEWLASYLRLKSLYPRNIINDTIIKAYNFKIMKALPIDLRKEISCVRISMIKYNDNDTLMNWATLNHLEYPLTGSAILDSLIVKAKKEHKCCRDVNGDSNFWLLPHFRVFPTLLLFHTLIVLVLAFVTQLFIKQKSVTEPI